MSEAGGSEAATLLLAREYVSMYGQMGAQSNTMLFQERPADLNALLAQASAPPTYTPPTSTPPKSIQALGLISLLFVLR